MSNYIERRPWGSFEVLSDNDDYKLKYLNVKSGHQLSVQFHLHRSEIWTVIAGCGSYINQSESENLKWLSYTAGDVIEIPQGNIHSIAADMDTKIFEVQLGDYFGEDDIVRLEDTYGRK